MKIKIEYDDGTTDILAQGDVYITFDREAGSNDILIVSGSDDVVVGAIEDDEWTKIILERDGEARDA